MSATPRVEDGLTLLVRERDALAESLEGLRLDHKKREEITRRASISSMHAYDAVRDAEARLEQLNQAISILDEPRRP